MDLERKKIEDALHRMRGVLHLYGWIEQHIPSVKFVNNKLVIQCESMDQVFEYSTILDEIIGWDGSKVFSFVSLDERITSFSDEDNDMISIWLVRKI
jgi:hypothetical protein